MTETISKKVIRNTVYNLLGSAFGVVASILLTPYIVHRIGLERFGIWAIVGVMTGYFGLLDFGIGTSFVKYIAEFNAVKDTGKISKIINTGLVFYATLGGIMVLLTALALNPILLFLKIPAHLHSETSFVLLLGVSIFAGSNAFSVFASVPTALQRMDITNKVGILLSIINISGVILFMEHGLGLRGLMINNAIIFLLSSIVNMVIAFKLLPSLKISLRIDRVTLGSLFDFGYKLQISRIANLISFQTDKVIITHFLNLGLVTFYQLGSSVLQQVRQVPLLIISALVPAVSEIAARKKKSYLAEIYITGSKYLIFVAVPLTFFVMASASLIMTVWMGENYSLAATVIKVLAIGYCAATVTGVASSIALGMARTDLDMKFGIFMAVLNLALSIILAIKVGFIGVVCGTSASLIIASVYYIKMFSRYMQIAMKEFFKLLLKPAAACFAPAVSVIILNRIIFASGYPGNRLYELAVLFAECAFFGAAYLKLMEKSGYFTSYERSILRDKVPYARLVIKAR